MPTSDARPHLLKTSGRIQRRAVPRAEVLDRPSQADDPRRRVRGARPRRRTGNRMCATTNRRQAEGARTSPGVPAAPTADRSPARRGDDTKLPLRDRVHRTRATTRSASTPPADAPPDERQLRRSARDPPAPCREGFASRPDPARRYRRHRRRKNAASRTPANVRVLRFGFGIGAGRRLVLLWHSVHFSPVEPNCGLGGGLARRHRRRRRAGRERRRAQPYGLAAPGGANSAARTTTPPGGAPSKLSAAPACHRRCGHQARPEMPGTRPGPRAPTALAAPGRRA